jgi:signal peptidase I
MRRTIGLGVAGLALVALTVLARRLARLEPVLVQGDSMRPTLRPGQRLAVGPLDRPPRRGDLVVVGREGFEVVKRVVGLPGEGLGGRVRFAYWPPRRLPRPARMRADVPVRRTRGR